MGILMVMIVPVAGLGKAPVTGSPVRTEGAADKISHGETKEQDASTANAGSDDPVERKLTMAKVIAVISEELGLPRGMPAKDVSKVPTTCHRHTCAHGAHLQVVEH